MLTKRQIGDLIGIYMRAAAPGAMALFSLSLIFFALPGVNGKNAFAIRDAIFVGFLFPFITFGVFAVFWSFRITRNRKNDPFRFSRKQIAYFQIPNTKSELDYNALVGKLKFHFAEIEQKGNSYTFIWPKDGATPKVSSLYAESQIDRRKLTVNFTDMYSDRLRIEVTVEPKLWLRAVDSGNRNFLALEELIRTLSWSNYRIPTNSKGAPNWG